MNVVYPLFAASSWPFAVLLAAPVFVVLFGLAFYFAHTTLQRMSNLLLGTLGSIVVLCLALYLLEMFRIPVQQQFDYLPIVGSTALAVGAAIGVALSVLLRKGLAWLIRRVVLLTPSHSENENEDASPEKDHSSMKGNAVMRKEFVGVLAAFFSFFSFMARLDSWEEIRYASIFDFVIIGPLWAAVTYRSFSRRSIMVIVVSVAVWLGSASLLSYWHVAVFNARLGAVQSQCMNNIKQIGLALKQYESRYGCLPPAYVADAEGKPMHSWRVLLLPFLEYGELHRQYSFDEPWDGPNNSKLHEVGISMYRCPCDSGDSLDFCNTSYFAVVGDGTAWPGVGCMRTSDIRDGPAKTILLVEVAESGIHWMEPKDLSFAEMDFHINGRPGNSISSGYGKSVSALMADGNVRRLDKNLSPDTLRALLTIAGGEKVSSDELD